MLKRALFSLLLLLFFSQDVVYSQSKVREFFSLSLYERLWVFRYPHYASRAYDISREAIDIVDSLSVPVLDDTLVCDGVLDAARHTLWMALTVREIGPRAACRLGCAHELDDYRNHQETHKCLHDSVAGYMDIHNNKVGLRIGIALKEAPKITVIKAVLDSLAEGNCVKVLSNDKGEFLDINHEPIPMEQLQGRWNTDRVLIPTSLKKWPP